MKLALHSRKILIVLPMACVVLFALLYQSLISLAPDSAIATLIQRNQFFAVDDYDLGMYFKRGTWALNGTLPYRDYFAEYPPLAIVLCGLPILLMRMLFLPLSFVAYRTLFILMMCGVFVWVVRMVQSLHQTIVSDENAVHQTNSHRPWLYLLFAPASIFFTYNRFDILASAFVLASIVAVTNKNIRWAWIWLAIAFCTKWYAVLLVPIYFSYYIRRADTDNRELYVAMGLSLATVILIHLPILLYGSIESLGAAYGFHVERGLNNQSFLALFDTFITNRYLNVLIPLFFILQFGVASAAVFFNIRTERQIVYWSTAAIACFIFFAKFQSPQWVLWLSPLLLITMHRSSRVQFTLFVLLEVLTYQYFPILFPRLRSSLSLALIFHHLTIATIIVYYVRLALPRHNRVLASDSGSMA